MDNTHSLIEIAKMNLELNAVKKTKYEGYLESNLHLF
jgi:hypothetical protein